MTTWTPEAVLRAAEEWVWVPPGSATAATDAYLVVAPPENYPMPPLARGRDAAADPVHLVDDVVAVVRSWGRDRLAWRVSDRSRPAGVEAELLRRGAHVQDRADVLATTLDERLDALLEAATTTGTHHVEARRVVDEAGVRDALTVADTAFGDEPADEARVADAVAEVAEGLADDRSGRVVAYVDGVAAAHGGWTLAGDVCRLWGGSTLPDRRGRGAYRAVLAERLRIARDAGATLGLVVAVVDTSSPILRRLAFTRYGEDRTLVLPLG